MNEIIAILGAWTFISAMAIVGGYLIRRNLRKSENAEKVVGEIIIGTFAGIAAVYSITITDLLFSTKSFTIEFWTCLGTGVSGLILIIGVGAYFVCMFVSRKR